MKRFFKGLLAFTGSYGLACVLLLFLFLLTFLGTIEQTRLGLYQAQQKYFDSLIVLQPVGGGLSVPLPGVYLLLVLFSINLVVGMILRFNPRKIGMLITHFGILFLLIGGLITHHFAQYGTMTLAPGETSEVFVSSNDWDLAIVDRRRPEANIEYLVPPDQVSLAEKAGVQRFSSLELPFDVRVADYSHNAVVGTIDTGFRAPTQAIDGFYLEPLGLETANERNYPALYLTLTDKQTGEIRQAILWGRSTEPWSVEMGGGLWDISLRRQRWSVPFAIRLEEFQREYHPGTEIARSYHSHVVKVENGIEQPVTIRMNEPLRHRGYTFFQASFIEDAHTGRFSSVLAVVRNPTERIPLWACLMVTLGMLTHFSASLWRYLKSQRRQAS